MFSLMAVVGGSGAGLVAHRVGYAGHFLIVAVVGAITLVAIAIAAPRIAAATTASAGVTS